MSSELVLVTQLAIILISAAVFTVICKALKQPLILGYIVAGFIVGPHLGLFPQFSPESVHEWSELGIIFLLFGLGLEFNFKKLLDVGSAAIISAVTICIGMFITGSALGSILHWSSIESLFLGGMMSMSSTTIIIKAYDDLGIKQKPYSNLVFGLLVVEDLLAVLMMVLFSTIAVSNNFSGSEMLLALAKLVVFLVICFVVGIYLLPTILNKAKKYLSDEILLLISVGLCFLMVILANAAGFSSALGAFLIGSLLSSTLEGERIEHLTGNIKNLFGAIFFVSVGMMVDPKVIGEYWGVILAITLVAMVGILIFSTTGVLLAGKNLDTALHVGFSLPQLGEFSFIIASLGCTLGVLNDFIYPVIVSVSVITTFTTPYMIKAADPVSAKLHHLLPDKLLNVLNRRSGNSSQVSRAEQGEWRTFIKKYLIRVAVYGLLLTVIMIAAQNFLPALADKAFPAMSDTPKNLILALVTLGVMSPFLYGMAVNGSELKTLANSLIAKDPIARIPVSAFILLRVLTAAFFGGTAIVMFTNLPSWVFLVALVVLVALFLLARKSGVRFTAMEDRFHTNLKEKDEYNRKMAPVSSIVRSKLDGYDVHIKTAVVSSDFEFAGRTLREMPFRRTSGVNIVKIQRGSKSILIPGGSELVLPGDILIAVGSNEQLEDFMADMSKYTVKKEVSYDTFNVEPIELAETSRLTGKHLKDTDMRTLGCMVVSVERAGAVYTNPNKEFKFESGDVVWMAGLQESIDLFKD